MLPLFLQVAQNLFCRTFYVVVRVVYSEVCCFYSFRQRIEYRSAFLVCRHDGNVPMKPVYEVSNLVNKYPFHSSGIVEGVCAINDFHRFWFKICSAEHYSIIRAKTFLSLGFQTVSIFQSSIVPFLLSKFMPTFTTGSLHKANRLE